MAAPPDHHPNAPPALVELSGAVLGQRYALGRILGAGGMGAVFEARDLRLERAVAIKVIRPGLASDSDYIKRFLREAQAASKIRHRNVVVILDHGEAAERGLVYSVMELLDGQDLQQLLIGLPEQRLPWAQACELLIQIASGLKAAHGQGVIHRDIKPANCFLTHEDDEPVIKVVDFGIAKLEDAEQTLTTRDGLVGTPSYIAPEVIRTQNPASPRSDVYSLGVVAYRMLTGKLPFTGETAFEVMRRACMEPAPSLREQVPELPEAVEELVLEMLAKEPGQRPADMGVVRQRLQAIGREPLGVRDVEIPVSGPLAIDGSGARAVVDTAEDRTTKRREVARRGTARAGLAAVEEVTAVLPGARPESLANAKRSTELPPAMIVAPPELLEKVVREPMPSPPRVGDTFPVLGDATLRMGDSPALEPSRRRGAGLGVAAVAVLAGVLGGVVWSMKPDENEPTDARSDGAGGDVAVVESVPTVGAAVERSQPEPRPEPAAPKATPLSVEGEESSGTAGETEEPEAEEPEAAAPAAAPMVKDDVTAETAEGPPVVEMPVAVPQATQATPLAKATKPKPPSGPPSDAELKKKLGRKIKAKCAAEMAGASVTVSFFVTNTGAVSLLTATPKNAAGECAKKQVVGTKFRPRSGEETPIKIVVE